MNKKLPSYAPLALVIVTSAIAASLIISSATVPAPTISIVTPSRSATGWVKVVPASSQAAGAAGSTITVGQVQNVTWNKNVYPSATVSVSIIRKTGDNPARYSLIRSLGVVPNTGSTTWTPAKGEAGDDIYVEVGCTTTESACRANITKIN